jgi:hypothetical protein
VEFVTFGEPLDGRYLTSLHLRGERQAGEDTAAVDEHRACAALPLIAALLRSGHLQPLAQGVEQHHARVEFQCLRRAVDLEHDPDWVLQCRGRSKDRIGRGSQRGERPFLLQQHQREGTEAARNRLPHEGASRLPHVGQRRHLL